MNKLHEILNEVETELLDSILPGGDNWANNDDVDCKETCHWFDRCKGNGPRKICSTDWKSAPISVDVVEVVVHILRQFDHYNQRDLVARKRLVALSLAEKLEVFRGDSEAESFAEGDRKVALHVYRERNSTEAQKLKKAALRRGEMVCSACDVDYYPVFGGRATRIVECHHNIPISSDEHGGITSKDDLKLLCATCHRIAHSQKIPLTVSEVKGLLKRLK